MKIALAAVSSVLLAAGWNAAWAQEKVPAPANGDGATISETREEHDARMQWFREARLGMFIHWGLYSQLAGEWRDKAVTGGAEWIQKNLAIPSSQYSALAGTWNPVNYNAREWVKLMKAAGVRYICITTKHHDGFCLWPTKMNDDWNITRTPWGKDLLKPLADACREEGVRFCIYHSVLDWHHPDWPDRPAFNDYAKGTPDKARFKQYLYGQLKELFTGYGPVGMIWLDGTWDRDAWTSEDGKALEKYIRSLQPGVVINNRSGYVPPQRKLDVEVKNSYSYIFAGDYISPEGEVPSTGLPGIDWETCQTMQLPNNWGYNRLVGFRPYADLLRQLVDVASKGGNMLLNVGPAADGELLPQARQCLEKFAGWMKANVESIHGTTASPFAQLPFNGRCTRRDGRLYLHLFAWPADGRLTVPITNRVKRAWLLADPERKSLAVSALPQGAVVALPPQAPDPVDSVVAMEVEGELQVVPPLQKLSQEMPVETSGVWPGREKELAPAHVTDGRPETIWAAPERARDGWVAVDLQKECEVSAAMLSDAPYGRTREFCLEAKVDGAWKKLAGGTTIGPEARLSFAPVGARLFRLTIHKASDAPVLAEFQLFGRK